MNALIIYDDVVSGVTSTALLKQAEDQADTGVNWSIRLRRLDMLRFTPTAAEAHLIALSLSHTLALSKWLMDWLEQWAQHRQMEEAALALICRENPRAPLLIVKLSQFVRRHEYLGVSSAKCAVAAAKPSQKS